MLQTMNMILPLHTYGKNEEAIKVQYQHLRKYPFSEDKNKSGMFLMI